MTAYAMQGDRERCLGAGMDDYISKPISADSLVAAFGRFREHQAQRPVEGRDDRDATQIAGFSDSTAKTTPAVNLQVLHNLKAIGNDEADGSDLLAEVVDSYLEDSPQRLQTLVTAMHQVDANGVHRAAHALRSLSSAVGAIELPLLCQTLEEMGRNNRLENGEVILAAIQAEYLRVNLVLRPFSRRQA